MTWAQCVPSAEQSLPLGSKLPTPSVQTPTVVSARGVKHVALAPAHGAPVTTEHALFYELPTATAFACVVIASNPFQHIAMMLCT